jgi:hypothetical protein
MTMETRTNQHLKIVGTLTVIYAFLHILLFLAIGSGTLLGCGISAVSTDVDGVVGGLITSGVFAVIGLVGIALFAAVGLAGMAVAQGRSWGKVATVIFALLMITEFPLGTAYGIYALWAIFGNHEEEQVYA